MFISFQKNLKFHKNVKKLIESKVNKIRKIKNIIKIKNFRVNKIR